MNISINVPSYKRADGVDTLSYIKDCQVWVCESEADEYRAANPGAEVIACEKGIQGNKCRIMNHILDTEFGRGIDVVAIMDDDISYFGYHEDNKIHILDADDFVDWVEKYSVVCRESGARFWGVNLNSDAQIYLEHIPFSFVSRIGGPFMVHLKHTLRYDERMPTKDDYDMSLQQLNTHRRILRLNKFFYVNKMGGSGSGQTGGCSVHRNVDFELWQNEQLVQKWGSKIVRPDFNFDRSHSAKKNRQFDINPVIRVPIKGI